MSDGRTYHDRLSCHDRHKTGPLTFQILSVKALDQRPYRKKGLWSEREQKFSLNFQNGNLKSWVVSVDPRNRLSILSSKVNNTKPSLSRPLHDHCPPRTPEALPQGSGNTQEHRPFSSCVRREPLGTSLQESSTDGEGRPAGISFPDHRGFSLLNSM